jgi:putative oxidoreductase
MLTAWEFAMGTPVTLIARLLLASIFLISGVRKLLGFSIVSGMMAKKGFPVSDVFLVLTIILEISGSLMLIANWNARYAAWALAAFTLASGTIFHAFWNVWGAPPPEFNNEFNHFLKNVAIVGGLLLVAEMPEADARRGWPVKR